MFDTNFWKNYPDLDLSEAKISSFGEGLINFSWVVEHSISGQKFFLQQLNTEVFRDVDALEHNLQVVENFLQNKDFPLILPLKNRDGSMHTHYNGKVFRVYHFVENTDTHQTPPGLDYIFSAAQKFAEFSVILSPVAKDLRETIADFHNLSKRFEEYKNILQKAHNNRKKLAEKEIAEIENLSWIASKFEEFCTKIPMRVYHHDAKMNNILFAKNSSEALFPVDLDTIMPGYIFSDFGDMVWSMVFGIDHNNPEKTYFDEARYNTLVDGYLSGFGDISDDEIRAMHLGGLVMSYMLAIRFLADFLNGDKYFKIRYENHNLDRAKFQIDIVKQLLSYVSGKI